MANVDRPFGARVVRAGIAAGYNAQLVSYKADAARSATGNFGDIYPGDFVTLEADGNVAPAVSGDTILGIAVAVGPSDDTDFGRSGAFNADDGGVRYLAYDRPGIVLVVDDPSVVVEIQEAGADLAESDVGSTFDITAAAGTAHGSRTTSQSTVEIDGSAQLSNDLRVVGLVDRVDNETGTNAKWLVKINNHLFG